MDDDKNRNKRDLVRTGQIMEMKKTELFPKTEKYENIIRARKEEKDQFERTLKKKELSEKMKQDDRIKKENEEKFIADQKRQQEEYRKQKEDEEKKQLRQLEGRLEIMIGRIQGSETPFEYTLAGINLGQNKSLFGLHLARKNIGNEDGSWIANMLQQNENLEKIELEGNLLGPEAVKHIAQALETNKTLKILDLESNSLTSNGQEVYGIQAMAEMLAFNTTLLYLNLGNNNITPEGGEYLKKAMERNKTLISLELASNHQLTLEQISTIQKYLQRNKQAYDAERKQEWMERKLMNDEDEKMKNLMTVQEGKKMEEEVKEQAMDKRLDARETAWQEELKAASVEKMIVMQRLKECSELNKKGKKGRKGKKGKGGKKKK